MPSSPPSPPDPVDGASRPDPSSDGAPAPTRDLALQLTLACSRFSRLAARRADVGVSSVSWRVVETIERLGPIRLSEIAEHERVSRPTTTTAINRLEEEGLVQRDPDPRDSRSAQVTITERGREQLTRWRGQVTEGMHPLLDELPATDLTVLDRAAALLSDIVESHDR